MSGHRKLALVLIVIMPAGSKKSKLWEKFKTQDNGQGRKSEEEKKTERGGEGRKGDNGKPRAAVTSGN